MKSRSIFSLFFLIQRHANFYGLSMNLVMNLLSKDKKKYKIALSHVARYLGEQNEITNY